MSCRETEVSISYVVNNHGNLGVICQHTKMVAIKQSNNDNILWESCYMVMGSYVGNQWLLSSTQHGSSKQ